MTDPLDLGFELAPHSLVCEFKTLTNKHLLANRRWCRLLFSVRVPTRSWRLGQDGPVHDTWRYGRPGTSRRRVKYHERDSVRWLKRTNQLFQRILAYGMQGTTKKLAVRSKDLPAGYPI